MVKVNHNNPWSHHYRAAKGAIVLRDYQTALENFDAAILLFPTPPTLERDIFGVRDILNGIEQERGEIKNRIHRSGFVTP